MGLNKQLFNTCDKELIVKKIITETVFFHHLLTDTKYMISGSFLISLYLNRTDYSDIDLYFKNSYFFKQAKQKIDSSPEFKFLYKSKYAFTYQHINNGKILQLVKSSKKNIYHLANAHDFANCCMAYNSYSKSLYITPQAISAWGKKVLTLNKTPCLSDKYPLSKFYNQFYLLASRIFKYLDRYQLSIHPTLKFNLKKVLYKYDLHLATLIKNNHVIKINSYAITFYIPSIAYQQAYQRVKEVVGYEKNLHKLPAMQLL